MTDFIDTLRSNGFEDETGGGGCTYLSLYYPRGTVIMATCSEGGGMPTVDDWWLGVHDRDGECHLLVRHEEVRTGSFLAALAAVKAAAEQVDQLPSRETIALTAIVREMIYGDGTDASLQRVIDLCNEAKREFNIERA